MKTNEVRPIDADALLDRLEMLRRNYTLKERRNTNGRNSSADP